MPVPTLDNLCLEHPLRDAVDFIKHKTRDGHRQMAVDNMYSNAAKTDFLNFMLLYSLNLWATVITHNINTNLLYLTVS